MLLKEVRSRLSELHYFFPNVAKSEGKKGKSLTWKNSSLHVRLDLNKVLSFRAWFIESQATTIINNDEHRLKLGNLWYCPFISKKQIQHNLEIHTAITASIEELKVKTWIALVGYHFDETQFCIVFRNFALWPPKNKVYICEMDVINRQKELVARCGGPGTKAPWLGAPHSGQKSPNSRKKGEIKFILNLFLKTDSFPPNQMI